LSNFSDECQEEDLASDMLGIRIRALDQASSAVRFRVQKWQVAAVEPLRPFQISHTHDGVYCVLAV